MKILRKERRNLPAKLTDEEVAKSADDLARVVQDVCSELLRQAQVKLEMKTKLAAMETDRDKLALRVVRREEDRLVDVETLITDNGVGGAVISERRLDTGALVSGPRPASEEEVGQMSFAEDVQNDAGIA